MREQKLQRVDENILHLEGISHLRVEVEELTQSCEVLVRHTALFECVLALHMATVEHKGGVQTAHRIDKWPNLPRV